MSPTGPQYSGTVASASGSNGVWTNPTNAEGNQSTVYSSGNISTGGSSTNALQASNFGFNIPPTAIINGIYVEFLRNGSNCETGIIGIMKAGTAVGVNPTSGDVWPILTPSWQGYGGSTYLWGTNFTYSDINNSGFGFYINAQNTHSGGTALVYSMRITVYWSTAPTTVAKRYIYQVFNSAGLYLGDLPNVTSIFAFSQEINTAGTTCQVTCGVSIDTSANASSVYTDESGNAYTDEGGSNDYYTDGLIPIFQPGNSGFEALIQNGNEVKIYEISYYYPNGKCMFLGSMERIEVGFGSKNGQEQINILLYQDGQDLVNYVVRANPYVYTADQSQLTSNNLATINYYNGKPFAWNFYGQTFIVGASVTNLEAINIELLGTANVTVSVYQNPGSSILLASSTQEVSVGSETVITFALPSPLTVTPGVSYFFAVTVDPGDTIQIAYQTGTPYASGSMYNNNFTGTSGGTYIIASGDSLYFETFSGTGSTTGTFTGVDPTTGMLIPILQDYQRRGGMIQYTSSSIVATGLDINYQFNTVTTLAGVQDTLTVCPSGFYWYVDLGTDIMYFKQANTVADIVLTKGKHINELTLIYTTENIFNQALVVGGPDPDNPPYNIYTTEQNNASIAQFGLRLSIISDTNILDTGTANSVATQAVITNKNEQQQTTVTVPALSMDITLFKPGLIIGFNGFGTFAESILAQIVRIDYQQNPDQVTLTLGVMPKRTSIALAQVAKGLLAQETIDNPTSPS